MDNPDKEEKEFNNKYVSQFANKNKIENKECLHFLRLTYYPNSKAKIKELERYLEIVKSQEHLNELKKEYQFLKEMENKHKSNLSKISLKRVIKMKDNNNPDFSYDLQNATFLNIINKESDLGKFKNLILFNVININGEDLNLNPSFIEILEKAIVHFKAKN